MENNLAEKFGAPLTSCVYSHVMRGLFRWGTDERLRKYLVITESNRLTTVIHVASGERDRCCCDPLGFVVLCDRPHIVKIGQSILVLLVLSPRCVVHAESVCWVER